MLSQRTEGTTPIDHHHVLEKETLILRFDTDRIRDVQKVQF